MKTKSRFISACALACLWVLPSTPFAQDANRDATKATTPSHADMTNAEVRKVDKDAKKITLKHEAIKNLDMPGMTMVFQVNDATLLDKTKVGDKVKFRVIKEGGAYLVTEIQSDE
jgi:Cu(I)/Ag(I) efflux system periplasmic protein CusF